eukprot:COSAG02_NODE_2842_length_7911_cov_6.273682_1_plen_36_part_00
MIDNTDAAEICSFSTSGVMIQMALTILLSSILHHG